MGNTDPFEQFLADPAVEDAISVLVHLLGKSQQQFQDSAQLPGISDSAYKKELSKLGKDRGGSFVFPYISSGLGTGAHVALLNGKVMTDLIGGIGVNFCHAHPEVVRAMIKASLQDSVMQRELATQPAISGANQYPMSIIWNGSCLFKHLRRNGRRKWTKIGLSATPTCRPYFGLFKLLYGPHTWPIQYHRQTAIQNRFTSDIKCGLHSIL